jgi:hypothetical protein
LAFGGEETRIERSCENHIKRRVISAILNNYIIIGDDVGGEKKLRLV